MWLLVLIAVSTSLVGSCEVHQPYIPSVKRLSNSAALLPIHGPTTWLPTVGAVHIHLTLSSGIEQGKDFFVWVSPHRFPEQTYSTLYLQLYPGKVWFPTLQQGETAVLFLQSIKCQDSDADTDTDTTTSSSLSTIRLRTIFHQPSCPLPFILPGASIKLQQFVTKVLQECQDPLLVNVRHLKWRQFSSSKLLLMQPSILIVDGTGQTLETAASMVDTFLAAHGVLSIAWEPSNTKVDSMFKMSV